MTKRRIRIGATIMFIMIFTIFSLVLSADTRKCVSLESKEEIESFDFTKQVGLIASEAFEVYPEKLYTPEDFSKPGVMESLSEQDKSPVNKRCTYRILVALPVGTVFSVFEESTSNSQKIWVDGKLVIHSDSAKAEAENKNLKCNFASFYVENEVTEIVVQRDDFTKMPKESFSGIYIGTSDMLSRLVNLMFFSNALPLGAVLAMMLIFLATYIFFSQYKRFLWFACTCGALAVSEIFTSPQIFEMLYPNTGWQLRMRFEGIADFLFLFFILLYLDNMYKNAVNKFLKITVLAVAGLSASLCLWLPFDKYIKFMALSPYILSYSGTFIMFAIIISIVRWYFAERHLLKSEQIIILIGGILFGALAFMDSMVYINYGETNILEAGVLIFVSANAIALTVSFMRTESELRESRKREREIIKEKNNLAELAQMKEEFMANVGHELKTPLTVMGSYAGLTIRQLEKNAVTPETARNLDVIQKEAVRLGRLVEQLSASAFERREESAPGNVSVWELLTRTEKFCAPVCSKNNNTISASLPEENLFVRGDEDALFQVLYNLITNSNRHTVNGEITLKAERLYKSVRIYVVDNGEGIPEDKLPYIFERGYSGDNSSGIGLYLCRDIIENYGGSIRLDNIPSGGAAATILLPLEGESNEQKSDTTD